MDFVAASQHKGVGELFDAIPMLAAQQIDAIEICMLSASFLEYVDAGEIERLVRDLGIYGVRVNSVHSPFGPGTDISSFDDSVHDRGVAAIIETIEFSHAIGARYVIVHAGHGVVEIDRCKHLDRAAGVIREVARLAEEWEVMLAVENLPPGYLCGDPEEVLRVVDSAKSDFVAVCFDTGHANMSGRFIEHARRLLPRTRTTHIHDNDGTGDFHRFPGDGSIDWPMFKALHGEYCPDAPLMVECIPPDGWHWERVCSELRNTLVCEL